MISRNNQEIYELSKKMLEILKRQQQDYELMLRNHSFPVYPHTYVKDIILNRLMEVDYQIRDYEEICEQIEHSVEPLYLDKTARIIKSEEARKRLKEYETQIKKFELRFQDIKDANLLRTDEGRAVHNRLVALDNSQYDLIRYYFDKEAGKNIKLTTLKKYKQLLKLFNRKSMLDKEIKHQEEKVSDIAHPMYGSSKSNLVSLKEKMLGKRIERLRRKGYRTEQKANKLIIASANEEEAQVIKLEMDRRRNYPIRVRL